MKKVLNLYAGCGGNRKLWDDVEVVAVENDPDVVSVYKRLFPLDKVVVADAHQYLLEHFEEFDFIWSSPPCPTHSKANLSLKGYGILRYPEMELYQEIIFLKHFYKGKWCVENVVGYYEPLIKPSVVLDRHYFWSNFDIPIIDTDRSYNVARTTKETLSKYHGIELPEGTKNQRKILRNAVFPPIGQHIFDSAFKKTGQLSML